MNDNIFRYNFLSHSSNMAKRFWVRSWTSRQQHLLFGQIIGLEQIPWMWWISPCYPDIGLVVLLTTGLWSWQLSRSSRFRFCFGSKMNSPQKWQITEVLIPSLLPDSSGILPISSHQSQQPTDVNKPDSRPLPYHSNCNCQAETGVFYVYIEQWYYIM